MEYRFRSIERWPRELTKCRKRSPFYSNYEDTRKLLDRELRAMGVRLAIIELALGPGGILKDGSFPRADARPDHPGVILSFKARSGDMKFPCDLYTDWQSNLRAIGLSLEALRKVDRYGVTRHAEQYRGWTALPPAIIVPPRMTVDEAAHCLAAMAAPLVDQITDPQLRLKAKTAGAAAILADASVMGCLYHLSCKRYHPDANNGQQNGEWHKLQAAADMLKKHFGLA